MGAGEVGRRVVLGQRDLIPQGEEPDYSTLLHLRHTPKHLC